MEKNEILMIYGKNYKEMTKEIRTSAKLAEQIGDKKKKIGLKPNLVVAKTPDSGATTHMEMIEGTIEYLQENGFKNISITEGSWVGDRTQAAFRVCGYPEVARKYGVKLVDNQQDTYKSYNAKGMQLNVCDFPMSLDFLINMPVLKGHCQTKITCALKNMKGLIPNTEKRHFHSMGLHKPIAHLNVGIHQDFIVVDNICGDLDFEDGGNPVVMNRIWTAMDPVLVDAYVCQQLHYKVSDVPYVKLAGELGVGCSDITKADIRVLGEDVQQNIPERRKVVEVADAVEEVDSCSACYGYLIPALDMLKQEGLLEKLHEKICIGQGYRGKTGELGVGNCTRNFKHHAEGCPPTENQIYEFLKEYISK